MAPAVLVSLEQGNDQSGVTSSVMPLELRSSATTWRRLALARRCCAKPCRPVECRPRATCHNHDQRLLWRTHSARLQVHTHGRRRVSWLPGWHCHYATTKTSRLPMHDTQLVPFALTLRPKTLSAVVHMVPAWGRDARANVIAATSPMQAVAPTMFPRLACVPQR